MDFFLHVRIDCSKLRGAKRTRVSCATAASDKWTVRWRGVLHNLQANWFLVVVPIFLVTGYPLDWQPITKHNRTIFIISPHSIAFLNLMCRNYMLCDLEVSFILLITTIKRGRSIGRTEMHIVHPCFHPKTGCLYLPVNLYFCPPLVSGFPGHWPDRPEERWGEHHRLPARQQLRAQRQPCRPAVDGVRHQRLQNAQKWTQSTGYSALFALSFFSFGFTLLATHKAIKRHEMC